jgi:hypothetical protein
MSQEPDFKKFNSFSFYHFFVLVFILSFVKNRDRDDTNSS